jgi:hypothetical protein
VNRARGRSSCFIENASQPEHIAPERLAPAARKRFAVAKVRCHALHNRRDARRDAKRRLPANGRCMDRSVREEPRWHAGLGVVVALALYVTLPPKVIVGPVWVLPMVLLVTLVPLMTISPYRHQETKWQRLLSIAHIAVLNAFNVVTIVLLFSWQLSTHTHRTLSGEVLLQAAGQIWLTNIIVYGLWFWEIDRRGPDWRVHEAAERDLRHADFLFPQMALQPEIRQQLQWRPQFLDYLFLSFTNATAFSPTDTFPLTRFAKVLMMAEALTSLVTIAIIAGRAINILGT